MDGCKEVDGETGRWCWRGLLIQTPPDVFSSIASLGVLYEVHFQHVGEIVFHVKRYTIAHFKWLYYISRSTTIYDLESCLTRLDFHFLVFFT